MNEFGPKSTLEDLECFAKNRGVSIVVRPPRYNSTVWTAGLKLVSKRQIIEFFGYGDKLWIAVDAAARRFDAGLDRMQRVLTVKTEK